MRIKQSIISFVIVLFFLGTGTCAYATHIYGGDLLYKHLSGNLYQITLTLYGDCSAPASSSLITATPRISIYADNILFDNRNLTPSDSGIEVSPVCPGMLEMTTCHISGTLPGVKKFVYTDTISLTKPASKWRFIFSGNTNGAVGTAGRSSNITNIGNPGSSVMQIEATLYNPSAHNSSPEYTNIPTPFYCMLPDQQYNQGAVDTDGDSLAFSLVNAVEGSPSQPLLAGFVNYASGYSGSSPVAALPDEFTFSDINGQLTFTPSIVQNSLVVCQVSEYKNGVLVGTSQREMTFIVAADCEGTPPSLKVERVNGGAVTGKNTINICVGTPSLSFDIAISNPDEDTTYITTNSVPAGATLTINNNNTTHPSVSFSWETGALATGVYTFFLDVKNNHCPVANRQTIAYTINVTPFPTLNVTEVSPTNCIHKAYVKYDLALGYIPRYLTINQGTNTILSYTDTTGTISDSLAAGDYTIIASCSPLCTVSMNFNVSDSGKLPLSPVTKVYCMGDSATTFSLPTYGTGTIITWYDAANNMLAAPPTPATNKATTLTWYVKQQYKVCESDKVSVQAIIHPLPDVKILTDPSRICYGDTLLLEASGGVDYTWGPENRVQYIGSKAYTRLISTGTFTVRAISEYGCIDSTSVTYSKIEPCCQFGYPTAFTPNNDGKNDGFNVIAFGNTYNYKLAVYNRWGQMVYLSYNPKQHWDGTFNGNPCETGSYYYFFEGTCLIGIREEHKGDITLIR